MVTDTDWEILNKRLEGIERSIEMLKKMVPVPEFPTTSKPADLTRATRPYGASGEMPCAFDGMSALDKMKPTGLVCNCPRCSPYCLSLGNLTDPSQQQQWRKEE